MHFHPSAHREVIRANIAALLDRLERSDAAQRSAQRAKATQPAAPAFAAPGAVPMGVVAVDGNKLMSRAQYGSADEAVAIAYEIDALLVELQARVARVTGPDMEIDAVAFAGNLRGGLGFLASELRRVLARHQYAAERLAPTLARSTGFGGQQ